MIAHRLKTFLDREGVEYVTIKHPLVYGARETAQVAHIHGKEFAKTVIVKVDGKLAMAVLAASENLDLRQLKRTTGAIHVSLVPEWELDKCFSGCEPGAMPPFGNLYGMDVFVSNTLAADEQIAFNAGSHEELIRMAYKDFERLVQPTVAPLVAAAHIAATAARGSTVRV